MRHKWLLRVRPALLASLLKKALRVQREFVQTPAGIFWVDPLSNFGSSILDTKAYESEMELVVRTLLSKGDCFVDLGANEGYFSIMASKLVGEIGHVFSIEPQSRLQKVLSMNIQLNSVLNVHVAQVAISDSEGTVKMSLSPDMNTGSSGLARATKYSVSTEEVRQTTLEAFIAEASPSVVKLLKIDIEGFEYEAIMGSKKLFEAGVIQHVALELHSSMLAKRGKNGAEIIDFLCDSGYRKNDEFESLVMSRITLASAKG